MIHYGLCKHRQSPDDRVVPYFYGVIEFTAWPPPQAASGLPDHWLEFRGDTTKPKAILVEYIEDACQMGLGNLSEKVALDALNAYVRIMEAYVLQCDFYPRNVLVDSRGRVVIVRLLLIILSLASESLCLLRLTLGLLTLILTTRASA